jgi:hypothetical protein
MLTLKECKTKDAKKSVTDAKEGTRKKGKTT